MGTKKEVLKKVEEVKVEKKVLGAIEGKVVASTTGIVGDGCVVKQEVK